MHSAFYAQSSLLSLNPACFLTIGNSGTQSWGGDYSWREDRPHLCLVVRWLIHQALIVLAGKADYALHFCWRLKWIYPCRVLVQLCKWACSPVQPQCLHDGNGHLGRWPVTLAWWEVITELSHKPGLSAKFSKWSFQILLHSQLFCLKSERG